MGLQRLSIPEITAKYIAKVGNSEICRKFSVLAEYLCYTLVMIGAAYC